MLMKHLLSLVFFYVATITCCAQGEQPLMTLQDFTKTNPPCLKTEIVYDGCNLLLCSDGEYMFLQMGIQHPALQMRMLMQGLTFYIDPTGKKKEKYAILFPSAKAVEENMAIRQEPYRQGQENDRPDIEPLLNALQNYGVYFDTNGKALRLSSLCHAISLDKTNGLLTYTVLIPISQMLLEKKLSKTWSVGLYSEGGQKGKDGPGLENGSGPENSFSPRNDSFTDSIDFTDDHNALRKIMTNDIDTWIKFTFSEICLSNK